ncbi:MAG: ABC transporter permease [Chloroflexota bacterium]
MAQPNLPSESVRRADQLETTGAVLPAAVIADEELVQERISSPMGDAIHRFRRNWAALISLTVILLLVVGAIFAPFLRTMDPTANNYLLLDAFPSAHHWFGTNGLGEDEYSRILFGLRVPLIVGIVGAAITMVLGSLFGVFAGYFGGLLDNLLARFADVMFAFPSFTLALIVVSLYGNALDPYFAGAGRVMILIIVFAIVGWPALMRFVRSLALGMKEQQFVEAARTLGGTDWQIIRRHLLPNMWGLILVQSSFLVISFIGTEAILSIFGLGVEAPAPDLGAMLFAGASDLGVNYWEAIFPSIFLTVLILSFTFLGDGIRDAVDPRGQS